MAFWTRSRSSHHQREHSLKLSLQDWIWTFVWPIGSVAAGAASLGELFCLIDIIRGDPSWG